MKNPPMTESAGFPETALEAGTSRVTRTADTTQHRRPCRVCARPNARPVVPIGSSRWWDLCHRCARVVARDLAEVGS